MVNTTALILAQARKGKNAAAEAMLFRQLVKTTVAIGKAAKASGDARVAHETSAVIRDRLTQVRDGYTAQVRANDVAALPAADRAVMQRAAAANGMGSPVPNKLTPRVMPTVDVPTTRKPAAPERDGHER